MKRTLILLVALFTVVVCANLPAAGNPGKGGNGNNGNNGGNQSTGVLDSTEEAELVYIREEEKLARDVYIALYDVWHEAIFLNISESEQRHMDTLLKMLILYDVEDPVGNNGLGVFTNPELGPLYFDLVDKGSSSLVDAYEVGRDIEIMDIEDIEDAIKYTDEPPLDNAYGNLLAGSLNHLAAFEAALGVTRKGRGKH